ncbi:hypothetical protein Q4601_12060 [Shewanella sp. 1_MG-2023]|uniref:hypothetical protein n=1 Tax=unclassified Shewanella TaxID=196818 RepID=UPI0026E1DBB3|nr:MULTISPECIES: hypothetical protein [unclassified Shewanella]MDO6610534.1 hypothetical protein [Shewanella sp. 7_MG-2023]MDO6770659.1 hypothetical protein [Shewanella sp. 2_MG-2023]MDO6795045.1 hypothetical protein [Shewanella sp. 1_MG-2023]
MVNIASKAERGIQKQQIRLELSSLPAELRQLLPLSQAYRLTSQTIKNAIIPNLNERRKPYVCPECHKMYFEIFTLGEHYAKVHSTDYLAPIPKCWPNKIKNKPKNTKGKKTKGKRSSGEIGEGSMFKTLVHKTNSRNWKQIK